MNADEAIDETNIWHGQRDQPIHKVYRVSVYQVFVKTRAVVAFPVSFYDG